MLFFFSSLFQGCIFLSWVSLFPSELPLHLNLIIRSGLCSISRNFPSLEFGLDSRDWISTFLFCLGFYRLWVFSSLEFICCKFLRRPLISSIWLPPLFIIILGNFCVFLSTSCHFSLFFFFPSFSICSDSMGLCHGKPIENPQTQSQDLIIPDDGQLSATTRTAKTPKFPFYSPSPLPSGFKNSPANSSVSSTPLRIFKRPFPPPSPAKHIRALLARRHGSVKPNEATIPEGSECEVGLDKNFGFSKQFVVHYELGDEVGRGHFGYTSYAKAKKGSLKGQDVAIKVIPKSKVRFYWLFLVMPIPQFSCIALIPFVKYEILSEFILLNCVYGCKYKGRWAQLKTDLFTQQTSCGIIVHHSSRVFHF